MRPIIEQRQPDDDDFYSPELIRFAAAGFCWVSAAQAVFGLWFVADAGCLRGECAGGDGRWIAGIILAMWAAAQIAVTTVGLAGFLYLVSSQRAHRTAILFASVGMIATVAILGATGLGLWLGW